jgi:hypothetical protein
MKFQGLHWIECILSGLCMRSCTIFDAEVGGIRSLSLKWTRNVDVMKWVVPRCPNICALELVGTTVSTFEPLTNLVALQSLALMTGNIADLVDANEWLPMLGNQLKSFKFRYPGSLTLPLGFLSSFHKLKELVLILDRFGNVSAPFRVSRQAPLNYLCLEVSAKENNVLKFLTKRKYPLSTFIYHRVGTREDFATPVFNEFLLAHPDLRQISLKLW